MREVPECLNRRYQALDDLIRELSSMSHRSSCSGQCATNDPGVKLMCNFWNILKEDPNCNLPEQVQYYMCPDSARPSEKCFPAQNITCFMANESAGRPSQSTGQGCNGPPLTQVLCNLKKAASFDKDCNVKLRELLAAEKHLRGQIAHLEKREKEGVQLLKEADSMWSSMEEEYKDKIAQSLDRQKGLLKELQEIEKSAAKWRKNKKDLESQLDSIGKCQSEITAKINQKTNDLKAIDAEIEGFKKKIDNTVKEAEATKKSLGNKKQASDARIAKIAQEISKLEKEIQEENKLKKQKDKEGNEYIKEAREDLQKICKVLLQKKLEKEDLKAEKNSLIQEINLLKDTCDSCKDRCKNKQLTIGQEILNVDTEIQNFQLRCLRCSQCVDTSDARKMCIDCPRCEQERQCLIEEGKCSADAAEECVCQIVKQKFLDNVFENMYTVLEKQIQTSAGKSLAEEIVNCLKRSRNGKLNEQTRRILQEFVLTTVKKNLNLTIVGGAVKTRCELDPDTYKQLMICLKKVKPKPVPKSDKATDVKKDPCFRWGGPSECNCPKGPKECICTKKAPPPPKDPTPCPPPEKEDAGEVVKCPHKQDTACGPDCGGRTPNRVGADVAKWRPDPCSGPSCPFGKNMRAAQCVLGLESLTSLAKPAKVGLPHISVLEDQIECKCSSAPTKPCPCPKDKRTTPRQQIIEEVMGMGGYVDVTPIEKVTTLYDENDALELSSFQSEENVRSNKINKTFSTNTFINHHVELNNPPKKSVLEDLWRKETFKFGTRNKKILFRREDKLCPDSMAESSSQDTISEDEVYEGVSNATSTVPVENLKLITSGSKNQIASDCSDSSKNLNFAKGYHHSDLQLSYSPTVTISKKGMNNMVQSLIADIPIHDKKSVTDQNLLSASIEWVTVDNLLKNIVSADNIPIRDDQLRDMALQTYMPKKATVTFSPKNTKQLKAGLACSRCIKNDQENNLLSEPVNTNLNNLNTQHTQQEGKDEKSNKNDLEENKISEVISNVKDTTEKQDGATGPYVEYKNTEDNVKQTAFTNTEAQSQNEIVNNTELINTPSGSLGIELDEEVIKKLHHIIKYNQLPFISMKENSSLLGRVNLYEYDPEAKCLKLRVLETDQGDLQLEVIKDEIANVGLDTLTNGVESTVKIQVINKKYRDDFQRRENDFFVRDEQQIIQEHNYTENSTQMNFGKNAENLAKKQRPTLNEDIQRIMEDSIFKNEKDVKKLHSCRTKPMSPDSKDIHKYKERIQRLYDRGVYDTTLHIIGENGVAADIKCGITKIASGAIALDLSNIINIGNLSNSLEYPALLLKSTSHTYYLYIGGQSTEKCKNSNCFLKKTSSDRILLFIAKPEPKNIKILGCVNPEPLYKVKVKGTESGIKEPPALIKRSPSFNYTFVLDKEFEKQHLECVNSCLVNNDNKCLVEIHKTESGILINFDENSNSERNAVIVRSGSGNLKILVQGPVFDNLMLRKERRTSKQLEEYLIKIPKNQYAVTKNDTHISYVSQKLPEIKSNSDSAMYKKPSVKENMFESPAVKLKRTDSGQYTAVLDKESKKSFINEMKSYLVNRPQGLIPIRKTDSGEITIVLNATEDSQTQYGALKITSSGNIYVVLDQNLIKGLEVNNTPVDMKEEKTVAMVLSTAGSQHILKRVKVPVEKSTTTSCNGKPADCICEPLNCICDHLKCHMLHDMSKKLNPSSQQKHKKSTKVFRLDCESGKKLKLIPLYKNPQANAQGINNNRRTNQCFCHTDSSFFLHSDSQSSLSKEILDVSSLCNKIISETSHDKTSYCSDTTVVSSKKSNTNGGEWDSWKVLPLQLPSFLKTYF